ncbi:hypothetical protein [Caenispirillum bisanense]|uniref:hypothetical protein n=1 Tax=Caenispirillum bisanense TaxID=414052 RepID=UPI0031DFB6B4
MFATDHTTLLRGLRIALHGIVKTHLQTTRPHLRLPDLLQTADAPAAFRAPRPTGWRSTPTTGGRGRSWWWA